SEYLKRFKSKLMENQIRLTAIGRLTDLPENTYNELHHVMKATAGNTGMNLCLALSYGGRTEIVDAARTLSLKVRDGLIKPEEITEDSFAQHLYQPGPDPDLVIRTAGELRLSNFLLWQASYSEFYSLQRCWPDFSEDDLHEAIAEYNRRVRKFGGLIESGSANDK
ncbi:MAG: polyprenyl diphosphate synthase, partial [Planctomycetota bacterium]